MSEEYLTPIVATLEEIESAVIEADDEFGKVAGGIRYWVKDCFLPALEKRNLRIWKLEEKIIPKEADNAVRQEKEES
jgi:hypothetical protein